MFIRPLLVSLLIGAGCWAAYAQAAPVAKQVNGGVLNGKAVSLPKPVYPEDARRAKLAGEVKVSVVIDESGTVISATTLSGPDSVSMRKGAEAAALQARFTPTLLAGQPVKVTGVIVYNFISERETEAKLRVMGVSTFLAIARHFSNDPDKLAAVFGGENMFRSAAAEFPEYASDLAELSAYEKLARGEFPGALDRAAASIRQKQSASGRWQFEVGQYLGDVFGPLMYMSVSNDAPDISKLDAAALRLGLNRMKDMTPSAPADFPPDVLRKLTALSGVSMHDTVTAEDFREFFSKMTELFETIVPGATK
jgi:TonB family protein